MPRKKSVNKDTVETVANTTFEVLPLQREKTAAHGCCAGRAQHAHVSGSDARHAGGERSALRFRNQQTAGHRQANITPLIDRLIDEGFVERRRDENDRRVVNVVLLPAGEEKLTSIRETIVRQVMRWTGTIPEKEFFELEHALQTISTVLESAQI